MSCDELRANQSEKVGQYIYLTNRVRGDSTVFDILQFLHMLACMTVVETVTETMHLTIFIITRNAAPETLTINIK